MTRRASGRRRPTSETACALAATPVTAEPQADDEGFAAHLSERYRRLSILTLELAEEAGASAINGPGVDRGAQPSMFDRRMAAMSRAIWAHRVIEKLRARLENGHGPGSPQKKNFSAPPSGGAAPDHANEHGRGEGLFDGFPSSPGAFLPSALDFSTHLGAADGPHMESRSNAV